MGKTVALSVPFPLSVCLLITSKSATKYAMENGDIVAHYNNNNSKNNSKNKNKSKNKHNLDEKQQQ